MILLSCTLSRPQTLAVNCVSAGDSLSTTLLALFGSHLEDLEPRMMGRKGFSVGKITCDEAGGDG